MRNMYAEDYRRIARSNLTDNWKKSILVSYLAAFLGGQIASGNVSVNLDADKIARLSPGAQVFFARIMMFFAILAVIQIVIGGVIRQGYALYLLKQHDRQDAGIHDLFSQFSDFKRGFFLALLQGLYIIGWMLLLIVPGIIASFSYSMAPFIMLEDPDMTPSDAIAASKALMKGHKWELFCLHISFIGWALLAALTLGLGNLALMPYMNAAHAAFYRNLRPKPEQHSAEA